MLRLMGDSLSLSQLAAAVVEGDAEPQTLLAALLRSTVFCEAPERPGVMTAHIPAGPVVPVYSSIAELAAARGAVAWFSTSGQDLLDLLPDGHDLLLDSAGSCAVLLRRTALRPGVHVS